LVERIEVEIFDVAFNIIGGGEEGNKIDSVATKGGGRPQPSLFDRCRHPGQ
jgi:hypothetical protein